MELKMRPEIGEINLQNAKNFMRIDFNDDDSDISFLLEVAKEYIQDALNDYDESKARVRFLVFAMTATLYQNREYMSDITIEKLPYHIRTMITQMNLGDDSNE